MVRVNSKVWVYEAGPREGLQNQEPKQTDKKVTYINSLTSSGLPYIEVLSFPRNPQMYDALDLAKEINRPRGVEVSALVPNVIGYNRAIESNFNNIAVVISANDEHNLKKLNRSVTLTKVEYESIFAKARSNFKVVRGYISEVWNSPIENVISLTRWYIESALSTRVFTSGLH